MNDVQFRILELKKKILDANYQYYDLDEPHISDSEYDSLLKELQKLEQQHPEYITEDSPTQKVGGDPSKYLTNVIHLSKMYSLDNVYSDIELNEYREFIKRKGYDPEQLEFYCDLKLDGISLSVTYQSGSIQQVATRGNGEVGEDITIVANKSIKNLRHTLKKPSKELLSSMGISAPIQEQFRGEAIIPLSVFYKKNADLMATGEKSFANARNMVAGLLRRLPTNIDEINKEIKFFCYGTYDMGISNQWDWATHTDMLHTVKEYGVEIVPYGKIVKGLSKVKEYYEEIGKIRNTLPMAIDGIVFRINSFEIQRDFGYTNKAPKFAMAYKFPAEQVVGIVDKIVYQIGRTGVITPVAEFKNAVPCNGVYISRATLHNEDFIKEKDIRIGDEVIIERSGDVIPKIISVLVNKREGKHLPVYESIKRCPCCGARTIKEDGDAYVYCSNQNCPERLKNQFSYIASKGCLNIVGFGPRIVDALYDKQYLKSSIFDIFKINKDHLVDIGFNKIRAESMANMINDIKRKIPLSTFLLVLGIPHIGKVAAKQLSDKFESLSDIINATYGKIKEIENFGDTTAEAVINYFVDNPNVLKEIEENGIVLTNTKVKAIIEHVCPLTGKYVIITGVFNKFNKTRSEMIELLSTYGIHAATTINKADFLLVGDEPSASKIMEADKKQKKIIYEIELKTILQV